MKCLALAFFLLAGPALAQEPATIMLPSALVTNLMAHLSKEDPVQLLVGLQQCAALQVPQEKGGIAGHPENCPAVAADMAKQAPKPAP